MKKISDNIFALFLCAAALSLSGCTIGEVITRESAKEAQSYIVLSPNHICIYLGETRQIDAAEAEGWSYDFEYESENPKVATVDATGKVTAVSEGETKITVTDIDGELVPAQCEVTVLYDYNVILSMEFTSKKYTAKIGDEFTIGLSTKPAGAARNKICWSSTNNLVATVDQSGLITAIDEGQTTISAVAIDGGGAPAATCLVTVEGSGSSEPGLSIDKCNSVDGWTTGNGSITLDTQNYRSGIGSLSITSTGHYLLFNKKFSSPINASAYASGGKILVTLYVSDASKVPADAAGQLEFTSSGTCDNQELCWSFGELGLKTGWNDLELPISSGHTTGGEIDLSRINYIRMYYNNPGHNIPSGVVLKLDRIRIIK
ncbi:MAG: Ig-like domain-containing protein [Bacteroidales bacterium]|nr:Ig-like domain-containing protein [Bacteroidales bacterium]